MTDDEAEPRLSPRGALLVQVITCVFVFGVTIAARSLFRAG